MPLPTCHQAKEISCLQGSSSSWTARSSDGEAKEAMGESKSVTDLTKTNEVIGLNRAKYLLTNDHANSFQKKDHEITQSESSVLTSSSNVKPDSHKRTSGKGRSRVLSLQEYRKQVGLKVNTQKLNQKLGIKVNAALSFGSSFKIKNSFILFRQSVSQL